jgi:tellurite resistance-related uncharacterized protein
MDTLPAGVSEHRRTRVFTEEDVPQGLLSDHRTRAGSWGHLEVSEGVLRYHVLEGEHVGEYMLGIGEPGVITPGVRHRVELLGPVRFHVVFLRAD